MSAPANPTSPLYWRGLINQSSIRFFILRALWDEDSYGYLLSKQIEELSWGFCTPSGSSLYPALSELEAHGLIHSASTSVGSRARKVSRISETGRIAFRNAAKALGEIIPAIRKCTKL